jgi:ribosomal protein S18 acetylase RimI-like enzyme
MEMANQAQNKKKNPPEIRIASKSDAANVMDLLQSTTQRHIHVDWYLPTDWIGAPTFLLQLPQAVAPETQNLTNVLFTSEKIQACLAITPDPLPAAWVRVAAVRNNLDPQIVLPSLLQPMLETLKRDGVTEIGWLIIEPWPNSWLTQLGFTQANEIVTYRKTDVDIPKMALRSDIMIRPVERHDIERLAEIETLAFAPLWQHSASALNTARSQAFSFDVALYDDRIVGFQLSAKGHRGVHLARLTIDPTYQGKAIGSTLLAHALSGYHSRGLYDISLNTPADNIASKFLYEKFGFMATEDVFPVWVMNL